MLPWGQGSVLTHGAFAVCSAKAQNWGIREQVLRRGTLKDKKQAQQKRTGRVCQEERTTWKKAWHVGDYHFSGKQPQEVPGDYLNATCIVMSAFSVYMAFTSTVTDSGYTRSSPNCLGTQQGLRVQVDK